MKSLTSTLLVLSAVASIACTPNNVRQSGEGSKETPTISSADPPSESSDDSPTPSIDRQVAAFLAEPGLDREYFPDWDAERSKKMEQASRVNKAIKARIAESDDRDVRAHLSIQRARIFLAVACQMVGIEAAPGSTDEEIRQKKVYGIQASDLFFPGADESLRNAVSFDGARSNEAGQMLLALRAMTDRQAYCESNRQHWRPQTVDPG